jgi:hypothetical protein
MAVLDTSGKSGNYALKKTTGELYLSAEVSGYGVGDWTKTPSGYAMLGTTASAEPYGPPQGSGPDKAPYESFVFALSSNETVGTGFGYQMDPVWVNSDADSTRAKGPVWAAESEEGGYLYIDQDIDAKVTEPDTPRDFGVVLFFPAPAP